MLCRKLDLFSDALVTIDGSKFKAVNARDKNFTPAKLQRRIEQVEQSIARYMAAMETADRQEGEAASPKSVRLKEKIEVLKRQMQQFRDMEAVVQAAPDQQVSLTDPDARSMATSDKGTGIVGYNVQIAVKAKHHLIVAHKVTNAGSDRVRLATMARLAQDAAGHGKLTALADQGYFSGWKLYVREQGGIAPCVPKPLTSGAKFEGRFSKQDFVYLPDQDAYRCPAGETLTWRFNREEDGKLLRHYWTTKCAECAIKATCTTGDQRRVKRWEPEGVLDAMQKRLDQMPSAMQLRRQTVEHPFGTIKGWMGATHFLTRGLKRVRTEMSLQVLAYNMKRVIAILGVKPLMEAIKA